LRDGDPHQRPDCPAAGDRKQLGAIYTWIGDLLGCIVLWRYVLVLAIAGVWVDRAP